jgi:hypothetical protein
MPRKNRIIRLRIILGVEAFVASEGNDDRTFLLWSDACERTPLTTPLRVPTISLFPTAHDARPQPGPEGNEGETTWPFQSDEPPTPARE